MSLLVNHLNLKKLVRNVSSDPENAQLFSKMQLEQGTEVHLSVTVIGCGLIQIERSAEYLQQQVSVCGINGATVWRTRVFLIVFCLTAKPHGTNK